MININRCYQILLLSVIFALIKALSHSRPRVTVIYLSLSQFCSEASGLQLYFMLFHILLKQMAYSIYCAVCSTLVFCSELNLDKPSLSEQMLTVEQYAY